VRGKKKLIMIGVTVSLLAAITATIVWWAVSQPLYEPGMVRAGKNLRGSLEPPRQIAGDSSWLVEPDIRLAFRAHGKGHPILVVHGGPGIPFRQPVAGLERLARDYKFYYYDQRGCGDSTRPFNGFESSDFYGNMTKLERTLGIGAQVADIERIRRLLGQDKLILLGHSFGGMLAALYAAEFPERIEALVLVAPASALVLPDPGLGFFGEIRKRLPVTERAEYDRFLREYLDFGAVFARSESDLARLNRRLGDYYFAAAGETRRDQRASAEAGNGGWMVQAMYFSMGRRHDYRPALGRVQAPVLIVHGEDDLMPEQNSRMYADCFPNARLHMMRKGNSAGGIAGHFLFDDQPELFAEAVGRFLAELH
jgi:proline iminopeptidase